MIVKNLWNVSCVLDNIGLVHCLKILFVYLRLLILVCQICLKGTMTCWTNMLALLHFKPQKHSITVCKLFSFCIVMFLLTVGLPPLNYSLFYPPSVSIIFMWAFGDNGTWTTIGSLIVVIIRWYFFISVDSRDKYSGKAVDVWAMGITLFCFLYGKVGLRAIIFSHSFGR